MKPRPASRSAPGTVVTASAIAIGCLAGLILGEIGVRVLLRYNTPDTVRRHSLQYLPSVFARHRLAPNQRVETGGGWDAGAGRGADGPLLVINERGYRGGSITVPKPAGVTRLVVLGGSAVFDINAAEGEDWPSLLARNLRVATGRPVEVINAGVPGHASFDSLGRLYSQIWMFEPDYVLTYHLWNDLKSMSRINPEAPLLAQVAPFDPGADPFQNYRGPIDRLLCHSQLYVKLRNRYYLRALRPGQEGARDAVGGGGVSDAPAPRPDDAGSWGRRQFRLTLSLIVDASRSIGAVPILLTQATLVTESTPAEDQARIGYDYQGLDHASLARALAEGNEIIRDVGREKGAEVIDLDRTLSGRSDLFADHVHTTAPGSRAIAREVADVMAARLDRRPGATVP